MHPIGQHFIGGFEGTRITPTIKKLIQEYHIGGFILFRRNIISVRQTKRLIQNLQSLSETPLFIGVDQEGGRVFRLGPPFTQIPSMETLGDYYRKTKKIQTIKEVGRVLGKELRALGFNWDYAPVVDVHSNPKNPIIGSRSFGPDPLLVSRCAAALMKGLHQEGVLSCAKHFPGHGATSVDSHLALPVLKASGRLLWKRDLLPFRKLVVQKIIPTIMTAHVLYPDLDPDQCATLSYDILTKLLRHRLRFRGIVISDDLLMKAISNRYSIPEACLRFFEAGGDMALIGNHPKEQIMAIELLNEQTLKSQTLKKRLFQSYQRIGRIKKRLLKSLPTPSLDVLGCTAHQKVITKLTNF